MLGLPTETDEDVLGIAEVASHVMHAWRESASNKNRGVRITVSTSWFVPKAHTAFQWEPQIPKEEYERRVKLLRENMLTKSVTYNWHDSDTSISPSTAGSRLSRSAVLTRTFTPTASAKRTS